MKTSSTLRGAVVGLSMSLTYCGSGLQRRSVHCQASTRLNASSSSSSSSSPSPPTTTLKPFYSEVISSSSSGSQLSPLAYREDRYGGVVVERSSLATFNEDAIAFATSLESSLAHWKSLSRRGVWLSIPTEQAALVPAAVRSGFSFHHAEKEYVMLNKWLSETEENRMPPNASHQVRAYVLAVRLQRCTASSSVHCTALHCIALAFRQCSQGTCGVDLLRASGVS
jgi:hypothetical protein